MVWLEAWSYSDQAGQHMPRFESSSLGQGLQNWWEPVRFAVKPVPLGSGLGRYQTGTNSKFKFKFKKNEKFQKKFLKIFQGATNLMVSNFLKNSLV